MLNLNTPVTQKRFTLRKHQILRSKKEIAELFEKGKTLVEHPLKCVYYWKPVSEFPQNEKTDRFKVIIIVPKKLIRKSAHRNRIKRKIKESFRLLQHEMLIPKEYVLFIGLIYISRNRDKETLNLFEQTIQSIFNQLTLSQK